MFAFVPWVAPVIVNENNALAVGIGQILGILCVLCIVLWEKWQDRKQKKRQKEIDEQQYCLLCGEKIYKQKLINGKLVRLCWYCADKHPNYKER